MVFTLGSDSRVSQRRMLPALKRRITLQGKKAHIAPEVVTAVRLIYLFRGLEDFMCHSVL